MIAFFLAGSQIRANHARVIGDSIVLRLAEIIEKRSDFSLCYRSRSPALSE